MPVTRPTTVHRCDSRKAGKRATQTKKVPFGAWGSTPPACSPAMAKPVGSPSDTYQGQSGVTFAAGGE